MADRSAPAFSALLSHHINSTSDLLRRVAALRSRREHDVSLTESRTLALVGHLEPVRLRDLTAASGSDKAQISRVVTALVGRGLILRISNSRDARSAHLELTDAGRIKAGRLARMAQDTDNALRTGLKPAEADHLIALLARVKAMAQDLVKEEERLQPGARL